MSKFIIFSAPSGSGKSTIINHLLKQGFNLEFSTSATSRKPRGNEQNGKEYYFLSTEEFRQRIANNEFLEYEEVYEGCFYGTLRSEIERISAKNHIPIFDVDVKGGLNIKKQYPNDAMTIFIQPPSIEELRSRLEKRSTDAPEVIEKRLAKAAYELSFADQFDKIIINDNLEEAKANAEKIIRSFLEL